jgi:hypothetical protein
VVRSRPDAEPFERKGFDIVLRHFVTVIVAVALLAGSTPVSAQSASIRITAADAVVREKANPESAPIVTVAAGTVLEVVAERDGWYEVMLPATATRAQTRGYVSAAAAERFGAERPRLTLPSTASNPSTTPGTLAPDWQGRYDRAASRRKSGVVKTWIGGPMALAGGAWIWYAFIKDATASEEEREQEDYWKMQIPGYALTGTGAVILALGQRQIRRAAEEMLLLETERTRAQQGVLFSHPITEGALQTHVDVGVGREMSASLRMSW